MMGLPTEQWPDRLSEAAWVGFIQWAHRFPEIRARFTAETGLVLGAPCTSLEAMIDVVTGARDSLLEQFVEWATREIWGLEYAPAKYREFLASRSNGASK